jgi:hypothetical protein
MKLHPAVRFLIPIVVAVVLGPLIAGLAVSLLAVGRDIADGLGALWVDMFGLIFVNIAFAYYLGGPIALIAGVLVSIWMMRRPPNAIVAVAAAAIATVIYSAVGALGVLGPAAQFSAFANFAFTLACAIVAALVCWLLVKRWAPTQAASAG